MQFNCCRKRRKSTFKVQIKKLYYVIEVKKKVSNNEVLKSFFPFFSFLPPFFLSCFFNVCMKLFLSALYPYHLLLLLFESFHVN